MHLAPVLFWFDENYMSVGRADVLADVCLGRQPAGFTRFFSDDHFFVVKMQFPIKRTQGNHHAIRVGMRSRLVAWFVLVFQYPDLIVFKNNFVFIRIRNGWIVIHTQYLTPRRSEQLRDMRSGHNRNQSVWLMKLLALIKHVDEFLYPGRSGLGSLGGLHPPTERIDVRLIERFKKSPGLGVIV